ncbi:DEAD/DEAH box helicase [Nocardia wallacei]|uniref:DEAD/DEAH box helicase n=1 Tax=Nocardia wallacei TaxID=480035 RepID=UPI002454E7E3|nr:DEAD/DEAH box helicase [Nocardia wallacei]
MFALWTWNGTTPGPGPADSEPLPLAVPTPDGTALTVTTVDCTLTDPEHFLSLPISAPGPSVTAWRAILGTDDTANTVAAAGAGAGNGVGGLPPVGHAVPNAARTAIVSAERAVRACVGSETVAAELRTTLKAQLRPYQARGIAWLRETAATHGGAVLADEMGLGKTVQAIGYLLGRAEPGPQLVVCPTSLVGNWAHEIERFAPGLRPILWRGGDLDPAEPGTIVVTGYPTLRGHGRTLAEIPWATAIFDEAQVLKNPRTQVSRAARALRADARIALTGTPVENHLDELWALLNLVAPRAFTHKTQFRRRFVRPIHEGSEGAAVRLRDTLEPIVLARKKIQVASALPPKIHTDLVCDLTDEQQRLYDHLLDKAEAEGFGSGAQRQSRVLAALTALKQVCNHPGLITGELDELTGRSGKFDVCADILASNLEIGSPTLVFTQYRRTGELLVRHCAERFGVAAPFFHGGLNSAERADIVRRFQSPDGPPVLVLSLRAAGTGLTLTRAADVVHYDRWWNPAVEAQASDRAHRIGQTRPVTITTLTTGTTVEEHIAGMHGRKSALADLTDTADSGSGVAALARLDDEHLLEILRRKRGN